MLGGAADVAQEGVVPGAADIAELELADRWILSRYNRCAMDVTMALEEYDLGVAAGRIYEFLWDEFCDWYIEIIKLRLYGKKTEKSRQAALKVMTRTLRGTLALLHPFMPYITEELWRHLPHEGETIMLSPWESGDASFLHEETEETMALMMETVKAARNLRSQFHIAPGKKADFTLYAADDKTAQMLEGCQEYIAILATAGKVEMGAAEGERPRQAASAVVRGVEVYMPLAGLVDVEAEKTRLRKDSEKVEAEIRGLEGKLATEGFRSKAPAEVITKEEEKLADARYRLQALKAMMEKFE
ncbi:MAG: class I tRNA ligase family protein [Peptococcaceae bacterium]|nr:class I tRNA ligase family protein [Peptococcaceae bacterium]